MFLFHGFIKRRSCDRDPTRMDDMPRYLSSTISEAFDTAIVNCCEQHESSVSSIAQAVEVITYIVVVLHFL